MFNRILILRGVIEIGNLDVGRFVVKKNMMVIDYYTYSFYDFFRNSHLYLSKFFTIYFFNIDLPIYDALTNSSSS